MSIDCHCCPNLFEHDPDKGPIRETMKQAGYKYDSTLCKGTHVLINLATGQQEVWFANKGHASYGITWRNTDLEYAYTITDRDKHRLGGRPPECKGKLVSQCPNGPFECICAGLGYD